MWHQTSHEQFQTSYLPGPTNINPQTKKHVQVWDPGYMISTKEKQKGFPPWWRRKHGTAVIPVRVREGSGPPQGTSLRKNETKRPLQASGHPESRCPCRTQSLGSPGSEEGCFFQSAFFRPSEAGFPHLLPLKGKPFVAHPKSQLVAMEMIVCLS